MKLNDNEAYNTYSNYGILILWSLCPDQQVQDCGR